MDNLPQQPLDQPKDVFFEENCIACIQESTCDIPILLDSIKLEAIIRQARRYYKGYNTPVTVLGVFVPRAKQEAIMLTQWILEHFESHDQKLVGNKIVFHTLIQHLVSRTEQPGVFIWPKPFQLESVESHRKVICYLVFTRANGPTAFRQFVQKLCSMAIFPGPEALIPSQQIKPTDKSVELMSVFNTSHLFTKNAKSEAFKFFDTLPIFSNLERKSEPSVKLSNLLDYIQETWIKVLESHVYPENSQHFRDIKKKASIHLHKQKHLSCLVLPSIFSPFHFFPKRRFIKASTGNHASLEDIQSNVAKHFHKQKVQCSNLSNLAENGSSKNAVNITIFNDALKSSSNNSSNSDQIHYEKLNTVDKSLQEEAFHKIQEWIVKNLTVESMTELDELVNSSLFTDNHNYNATLFRALADFHSSMQIAFDNYVCFFDEGDIIQLRKFKAKALERAMYVLNYDGYEEGDILERILHLACNKLFILCEKENEEIIMHEQNLLEKSCKMVAQAYYNKMTEYLMKISGTCTTKSNQVEMLKKMHNDFRNFISNLLRQDIATEHSKLNKVFNSFLLKVLSAIEHQYFVLLEKREDILNKAKVRNTLAFHETATTNAVLFENEMKQKQKLITKCNDLRILLNSGKVRLSRLVANTILKELDKAEMLDEYRFNEIIAQDKFIDQLIEKYNLHSFVNEAGTSTTSNKLLCGFYNKDERQQDVLKNLCLILKSLDSIDFMAESKTEDTTETVESSESQLETLQDEIDSFQKSVDCYKSDRHFTKLYRTYEATGEKLLQDLDSFDYQQDPAKRKWRATSIYKVQNILDHLGTLVHSDGKVCKDCELSGTKWE